MTPDGRLDRLDRLLLRLSASGFMVAGALMALAAYLYAVDQERLELIDTIRPAGVLLVVLGFLCLAILWEPS